MSIDTYALSGTGFHCEAVTAVTIASPCFHSRLANNAHAKPAGVDRGADDPAVLIGLTLALVRQGPLLDGHVPEPVMLRLNVLADGGNAACRLLLDWLQNRNRNLRGSDNGHLAPSTPIPLQADAYRPRLPPRERVLAASTRSSHMDERRRGRTRPRDPVLSAETAIIAAETGGRVDG